MRVCLCAFLVKSCERISVTFPAFRLSLCLLASSRSRPRRLLVDFALSASSASPLSTRVPHEQQLGTPHTLGVVVSLCDDVAGVGQAQTEGEQLCRALESSKPRQSRHLGLKVHLDGKLGWRRRAVGEQLRQDRPSATGRNRERSYHSPPRQESPLSSGLGV